MMRASGRGLPAFSLASYLMPQFSDFFYQRLSFEKPHLLLSQQSLINYLSRSSCVGSAAIGGAKILIRAHELSFFAPEARTFCTLCSESGAGFLDFSGGKIIENYGTGHIDLRGGWRWPWESRQSIMYAYVRGGNNIMRAARKIGCTAIVRICNYDDIRSPCLTMAWISRNIT